MKKNPNPKTRNPKQTRSLNKPCSKVVGRASFEHCNFGFGICFGFRISDFGFSWIVPCLALALCASVPLSSNAGQLEPLLVIGCDGFGSVGFTDANTPVLHRLMREGAY